MSKVANYLNEHIQGEVTSEQSVRHAMSIDASLLTITPEMVVYPRITNDIRKTARFSNQLAEKGHTLPITARGGGSDQTGAAIGKGIILNTTAHMNRIFELDMKQKLVRVQPGVTFKALNDALALHGLYIPSAPVSSAYSTIGGAIANNASGRLSGKYGATGSWVQQIEVVLSNGDIMQTGRISKRDLNRKKGQQTFEGEIYRQIDNIISDNAELIESSIDTNMRDNAGYPGIADVKRGDGSFDLAPLIIGSQGTLGIVSEVIMKADFIPSGMLVMALAFDSWDVARDAIDVVRAQGPAMLELIDGRMFVHALERGKKYAYYTDATEQGDVSAIVLVAFDDSSDRHRNKKAKRIRKALAQTNVYMQIASQANDIEELMTIRDVSSVTLHPDGAGQSAPPLVDGVSIPTERFEDFMASLDALSKKYHVELPLYGNLLDGVYYVRPTLEMSKAGDKQKIFKLSDEFAAVVVAHGGFVTGESAEGRFKALFAAKAIDDDLRVLYASIKLAFDPFAILNPGVKESPDAKSLVQLLRKEYDLSQFADYSPTN